MRATTKRLAIAASLVLLGGVLMLAGAAPHAGANDICDDASSDPNAAAATI